MSDALDTHAVVWYLDKDARLSERARQHIADPQSKLLLPTIVLAELVYLGVRLQASQRLQDAVERFRTAPQVQVIGFAEDAVRYLDSRLDIHDAILAASALAYAQRTGEPVRLITRDERIAACGLLECLW